MEGAALTRAVRLLLRGRISGDVLALLLSKARRDTDLSALLVRKLSRLPERQLLNVLRREPWLRQEKDLLLRLRASPERDRWIQRSRDARLRAALVCERHLPQLSNALSMMHYEAETIARLIGAMPPEQAGRLAVGIATVVRLSLSDLPPSDHLWRRTLQLRLRDRAHLLLGDAFLHYLSFMVRLAGKMQQRLERTPVGQLPLVPDTSTITRWSVRIWPSLLLENPDVLLANGAHLVALEQKEPSGSPVSVDAFFVDRLVDMLWRHRMALARHAASFELMRQADGEAFLRRLVVDYGAPSPLYDPTGPVPVLRIETRAGEVVQPFNEATVRNVLAVTLPWDQHLATRLTEQVSDYLERRPPPPPTMEQLRQFAFELATDIVKGSGRPLVARSFAMSPLVSLFRCRKADQAKTLAEELLAHWTQHQTRLSTAMLARCMQETRRLLSAPEQTREMP